MSPTPIVAALSKGHFCKPWRPDGSALARQSLEWVNWSTLASELETFFVSEGGCNNIQSMSMKEGHGDIPMKDWLPDLSCSNSPRYMAISRLIDMELRSGHLTMG
ncbi:hypothetical protein, partial [Rhizobium sp. SEMIA 4085]|uniref:hypothetical protein n=1 Tax=Rhizobium sp. SEMIA 4085 TaxID=2137761 RepID=UPI001AED914D